MKTGVFSIPDLKLGKYNVKDQRLDQVDKITNSKKKTYLQIELVAEADIQNADAILTFNEARADLILKDLDFVETRLLRAEQEEEKNLLKKLKDALEKEEFISKITLSAQERRAINVYSLYTAKPVVCAQKSDLENIDSLLARALLESGYISFFTTGEKETRAWLIRGGTTAWEAAGAIHSDIQKGFIRAEIISFNDFIQCGGEAKAKQGGKQRLENKEYLMQDCDLVNFRFNK